MKPPLSQRLLACCSFVAPGAHIIDIGCDHGYLGIHLLKYSLARSVIAADINEGPLQCAMRNTQKYGIHSGISFFLSDGVKSIPQDFDVLVCAGMGSDTMVSIISAAPWLQSSQYRLILQCQSKTHLLRQYLSENGWYIAKEQVLKDGKFLYTVMECIWQPGHVLTVGGYYFPAVLLDSPSQAVSAYYHRIIHGLEIAVSNQKTQVDPMKALALNELKTLPEKFQWLKEDSQ